MEEIEKRKMTKDGKIFTAIIVPTIMDAVDAAQEYQIPREDLVTILQDKEGYVVFCYK